MIDIEIDQSSGFCFGVINAIKHAEEELHSHHELKCLGDIVHNAQEVNRLNQKGLKTIDYDELHRLRDTRVLFRAHGEAPEVYDFAHRNNIQIIDATCPVVLQLQKRIRRCYLETRDKEAQIVIFGKPGHAEVNGLVGQTEGHAIVIQEIADADTHLDYTRPILLFSQTTKSREAFRALRDHIRDHMQPGVPFDSFDTICRQVSNRIPDIIAFAQKKDWVYFIAGKNSSNGKVLYEHCLQANPNTTFISSPSEITEPLPDWVHHVGICGATSTPKWLMEEVAAHLRSLNNI